MPRGRKKKEETFEELAMNELEKEIKEVKEEIDKIKIEPPKPVKESVLFSIKCDGEVLLRKKPIINNNNINICGKMVTGRIYEVVSEVTFSAFKMYKLKIGYYVIADNKVKIV